MVELSDDAKKELDAYFEGKEKGEIRIYLMPGGCSGPRLGLALDAPTDADVVEEANGYKFCIDRKLSDDIGNVKIEITPMGFDVVPEKPLPQPEGGSGCGGCCGGCGQ